MHLSCSLSRNFGDELFIWNRKADTLIGTRLLLWKSSQGQVSPEHHENQEYDHVTDLYTPNRIGIADNEGSSYENMSLKHAISIKLLQ
jgi:hypothetical protein